MDRIKVAVASIATAWGIALPGAQAIAEEKKPEEIVVTANRVELPLRQIGSSVSVLTADDLETRGIVYVQDAFRDIPGISLGSSGRPGSPASIFIRGEEGYRTLVLIDGIKVSDPSGTQSLANIQNVLAFEVERIEVVRGAQSLLYGADAMGGVINIITRKPGEGFDANLRVEGGSYETLSTGASLYWGGEVLDVALHASRLETEGFSAKKSPDLNDDDGYENTSLHGTVGLRLAPGFRFDGVARYVDADNEFDGFPASFFAPADPVRNLLTEEFAGRGAFSLSAFDGILDASLAYSYFDTARTDQSNRQPFAFGAQFDGRRHKVEALADIQVTEAHGILLGADYENERADFDASRDGTGVVGVFGEWRGAFMDRLFLTGGIRFDDHEDFGSHHSYRASAAYLVPGLGWGAGETKLRISVGTGFRAPSLFEQGTNRAALLPELEEEESFGWDAGFDLPLAEGRATLSVTYFRNKIDNEIRFDNVGFTGYFQAAGRAVSEGVETLLSVEPFEGFTLQAAYTHLDAKVNSPDAEDGFPRLRRPRHNTALNAEYAFWNGRARVHAGLNALADRQDGFSAGRVELEDYTTVDAGLSVDVHEHVTLTGRVSNAFNEEYEDIEGFNSPGAAGYLGLRLAL